jgi:hypothetical protein
MYQLSKVLVDVDLVAVKVVDGRQPDVEQVVVVMQRPELKQGDGRAVVVIPLSLLVLQTK